MADRSSLETHPGEQDDPGRAVAQTQPPGAEPLVVTEPTPTTERTLNTESGGPIDLAQLVTEHYAVLFRYAYRLSGSAQDAEDLTQQTFLTAQTKLAQLRDMQCARSWLFTILRNAYLRVVRKPAPTPVATLKLNIDELPGVLPDDLHIDQERLQAALNELGDDFKLVVVMFYFDGLSYRQIAEQLNLPLGTVMSRLSRAKGHLRARLFDADEHAVAAPAQALETRRG
jgi:RNA polymerase sigma-70 factor (ECF subfamily)